MQDGKKKIFGLEKNIFILGLTSFFNDFSNEIILSSFPAFFTSVLKSGAASLGLVEGIADGASNILKIYSGRLSDKLAKRRPFIFLGYGLSVAVRPFYILASSVSGVLGLRILDRVGKGVREAPRDVIISVSSPENEMGRSFGYHRTMDTIGGILGPLVAYIILTRAPNNWTLLFMTAFVLGIISFVTIFFVKEVVTMKNEHGAKIFNLNNFSRSSLAFKYYLIAIFVLSIGSLPSAVLLLKTTSIGLVIASVPLFYMLYSLSYSSFSYLAGKTSDRIGITRVLAYGYVILIISYIAIAMSASAISLALSFIIMGVFSACTDATQRSFIAHTVPEYDRGSAYGLYNASIGFGSMIAGIAGGYVWQVYGSSVALLGASVVVVVGLVFFYLSSRTVRKNI
jgi:MFS family permease